MVKKNERIIYLKAIGIILVVLAHSNSIVYINNYIAMFHMPLFFIASGYCFKEKNFSQPFCYIFKKVKKLWCPFIKYSLLFVLLHNVFFKLHIYDSRYWNQHEYSNMDYIKCLKDIILHMEVSELLVRPLWFLNALFWGTIFAFVFLAIPHFFLRNSARKYMCSGYILSLGGALLICIILCTLNMTFTILYIGPRTFLTAAFIMIGFIASRYDLGNLHPFLMLICVMITFIAMNLYLIRMKDNLYVAKDTVPYFVVATMMTWTLYSLPWNKVHGNIKTALLYIGENTLPIFIWHFLAFKLVSLFIIAVYDLPINYLGAFHVIYEYANKGYFVLYTIVGLCIPLVLKMIILYFKGLFLNYKRIDCDD